MQNICSVKLQSISVLWVGSEVLCPEIVVIREPVAVDDGANNVWIISLSLKSINHIHLLDHIVRIWNLHHILDLVLHLLSNHHCLLVFNLLWVWLDASSLKVVCQLLWNFFENLSCKEDWVILDISKWHKLNDISCNILLQVFAVQWAFVTIKLLHLVEVCISNTNNNDREWKLGSSDDFLDGAFHVVDDSICQNETNSILLIELRHLSVDVLGKSVDLVQDT